jgi:hypothetical protein
MVYIIKDLLLLKQLVRFIRKNLIMKKLLTLLLFALFMAATVPATVVRAQTTTHDKKDGKPDKRYKENKLHLKKDGTPDMRYKENKQAKATMKGDGGKVGNGKKDGAGARGGKMSGGGIRGGKMQGGDKVGNGK